MGNPLAQKTLMSIDTLWKTDAFIESIKAKVFNEVDSIHLDGIDFGSKFYPFAFLASDNGTDYYGVTGLYIVILTVEVVISLPGNTYFTLTG